MKADGIFWLLRLTDLALANLLKVELSWVSIASPAGECASTHLARS